MEYKNDHFQTTEISDITKFARFLERFDIILLSTEIKAVNGAILVQAERPLTEKFITSLLTRDDIAPDTFTVNNTENLKAAITNKIIREFEKKLTLSDYSFPSFLLKNKPVDIRRIVRGALNNSFFLGYITTIFMQNKAILNHIMEVTITSIGLMSNTDDSEISYNDYIKLFQASILHDYAIYDNPKWHAEESFETETDHDRESAIAVSEFNLAPEVPELILTCNKLQARYGATPEKGRWYENSTQLMTAILNLSEYYSYLKRTSTANKKEETNEMRTILYQLSLIAQKGFFPSILINSFEKHFSAYGDIFKYGKSIGRVESMCIHDNLASAFPKPKSTQLLCKNSNIECRHRIYSQPLKVVTETGSGPRFLEKLNSGWYDKCNFSTNLPEPPENI